MRFILLLALSFSLLPVSGGWADCICKEPLKPELPSGKADAKEMALAGKDVDDYAGKMKSYRECLVKCMEKADNDLAAVVSGWNYAVDTYNAAGSR